MCEGTQDVAWKILLSNMDSVLIKVQEKKNPELREKLRTWVPEVFRYLSMRKIERPKCV